MSLYKKTILDAANEHAGLSKDDERFPFNRTCFEMRDSFILGAEWAEKELKKYCPCGGIILADTEDWPVPLCNGCYEFVQRQIW